jgi:SAM-dependent methyltransferase
MPRTFPLPPPELAARIGGSYEDYSSIGAQQRVFIESVLPGDWSFAGKTVLDFGCGAGRTLVAFESEGERARLVGCDIHQESIAWAQANLVPPFEFFTCSESPPLRQPDEHFDLIYAMSVFTHIAYEWSHWVAELHRVMRPGGIAVISVLGPAMAQQILGREWDDRIGIAMVDMHKDWSVGGPSVLISEWWLREHWGRAFDVLDYHRTDPTYDGGHDLVVLRRREAEATAESLAQLNLADPREEAALVCNLELLLRQQEALGQEIRELQDAKLQAERGYNRARSTAAEAKQHLSAAAAEIQRLMTTAEHQPRGRARAAAGRGAREAARRLRAAGRALSGR